jgi:signal transduction histidine kinase
VILNWCYEDGDKDMKEAGKDLGCFFDIKFNPFSRVENAEAIQGTGLGLSIVKQAIKLHNGKIKIQSIQNEKTTFTVTLPNKD